MHCLWGLACRFLLSASSIKSKSLHRLHGSSHRFPCIQSSRWVVFHWWRSARCSKLLKMASQSSVRGHLSPWWVRSVGRPRLLSARCFHPWKVGEPLFLSKLRADTRTLWKELSAASSTSWLPSSRTLSFGAHGGCLVVPGRIRNRTHGCGPTKHPLLCSVSVPWWAWIVMQDVKGISELTSPKTPLPDGPCLLAFPSPGWFPSHCVTPCCLRTIAVYMGFSRGHVLIPLCCAMPPPDLLAWPLPIRDFVVWSVLLL